MLRVIEQNIWCNGLNTVVSPQNSHVHLLTSSVTVLGRNQGLSTFLTGEDTARAGPSVNKEASS